MTRSEFIHLAMIFQGFNPHSAVDLADEAEKAAPFDGNALVEAAVKAERAACARVCDELEMGDAESRHDVTPVVSPPRVCARYIRARGI